jgi:hypothetical protein
VSVRGCARDDPIDGYLVALAEALHGPARAKARLLTEIRDGLVDTATDLAEERGDTARRDAVREFGTVAEVAASCQRELTIAQARHTSRMIAVAVPFLVVCWYLVEFTGAHQVPGIVQVLAAHLGAVAAATALMGAAFLAGTGALARRLPTPAGLPLVVAWTGTTAAATLAVGALALTVASLLASHLTVTVVLGALTIVFHARIASAARVCRRCARLSGTGPEVS